MISSEVNFPADGPPLQKDRKASFDIPRQDKGPRASMTESSDIFLLVRPPNGSQRSANDLQIQLLHQRSKQSLEPSSARSSGEFSRSDVSLSTSFSAVAQTSVEQSGTESNLQRTASVRSNRSSGSSNGSQASAFNRRTTPLYNLLFHKLMSTTVTDAVSHHLMPPIGETNNTYRELMRGLPNSSSEVFKSKDCATSKPTSCSRQEKSEEAETYQHHQPKI